MKRAHDAILHADQADYLERMIAPRSELLLRMEEAARAHRRPISDPEVGHFLFATARAQRPRLIVELGTNIGYGAIVLAQGAGPEARVLTVEKKPELVTEARHWVTEAKLEGQIEVREDSALAFLDTLPAGQVDLAYVDCVKEEYPEYLKRLVPLLSERGMIIADNVLWGGLVARREIPADEVGTTEGLREFNRALLQDPRMRAVILPLGDGIAYAVRV
jgi:predicted O-methyltransferase YrrM